MVPERTPTAILSAPQRLPKRPTQGLLPQSPTLSLSITTTAHDEIKFPRLKHFEQSCTNTNFELDADGGVLTAKAAQNLR
jgi:hypothetical protein